MNWIKSHTHAVYALLFALFLLIQPEFVGQQVFTSHDWIKAAIAAVGLVVAFVAANTETTVGRYAKEIAVVLTAALVTLDNVIDGPWTSQKLMQVVAAAIIAAGTILTDTTAPRAVQASGEGYMGDSLRGV